jgi:hypothetical protein
MNVTFFQRKTKSWRKNDFFSKTDSENRMIFWEVNFLETVVLVRDSLRNLSADYGEFENISMVQKKFGFKMLLWEESHQLI